MSEKKFIIWDPKDNYRPRCDEDGNIVSDGVIGRVTATNVYMTTYAEYPNNSRALADLQVGEAVYGVKFSLSGSSGIYDIYRVQ